MEYRILGPLEVVDEGRVVTPGSSKQRALLAILLLSADRVVSRDRLVDELWDERPPETAAAALNVYVSQLRKTLGSGDDAGGDTSARIVTKPPGYLLRTSDDELDLRRFERLAAEGRYALDEGDAATAARLLREALALWRGPALAEFAAAFAHAERSRLDELRLAAFEQRIEAELLLGRHRELVPELEGLVREHPLRERLRAQLMLALYRCGRQADALERYRQGRRLLSDELGLEPGEELRTLERGILAQDAALAAPPAPITQRLVESAERRSRLIVVAGAVLAAAAAAALVLLLTRGGSRETVTVTPNSVAAVDERSGRVVADIPVGGRPVAIAPGAGAVWVANGDDGTLVRIDPRTRRVVKTIGLGGDLDYVAVGFGSVWVAGGNDETLFRIDPRRNAVEATLRFGEADPLAPQPVFLVAAGSRYVWVTRGNRLLAVDPATNRPVASVPVPTPGDLAVAGDVWVTTATEELIRVAEGSRAISAQIALPDQASSPVRTREGLWLIVYTETPQVWRVGPDNLTQTASVPFPSGFPVALAAGNSLWVADHGTGVLSAIDPSKAAVTRSVAVGHHPISLAAADGLVWVGVQKDGFR